MQNAPVGHVLTGLAACTPFIIPGFGDARGSPLLPSAAQAFCPKGPCATGTMALAFMMGVVGAQSLSTAIADQMDECGCGFVDIETTGASEVETDLVEHFVY